MPEPDEHAAARKATASTTVIRAIGARRYLTAVAGVIRRRATGQAFAQYTGGPSRSRPVSLAIRSPDRLFVLSTRLPHLRRREGQVSPAEQQLREKALRP